MQNRSFAKQKSRAFIITGDILIFQFMTNDTRWKQVHLGRNKEYKKLKILGRVVVAHAFNPRTREAEAGRSL